MLRFLLLGPGYVGLVKMCDNVCVSVTYETCLASVTIYCLLSSDTCRSNLISAVALAYARVVYDPRTVKFLTLSCKQSSQYPLC